MGSLNETVRTANSALRTLIFGVLVAGAGFAGWQGYSLYNQPQKKLAATKAELVNVRKTLGERNEQIDTLTIDLQAKTKQLERAQTSLRLIKLSHRIAQIYVVDQQPIEGTNRVMTTVEFFEVNDEGAPINNRRQKFEIEGDRIYVECLIAKFEDKYIEEADLDRATAISMFQRIFGEYQQPNDGFPLDPMGSSPTSYERGGKISEFEQKIWDDFWEFAGDRNKAAEIGIRAAHADAPSTRVKKGMTYQVELRATGGISLVPLKENPSKSGS